MYFRGQHLEVLQADWKLIERIIRKVDYESNRTELVQHRRDWWGFVNILMTLIH